MMDIFLGDPGGSRTRDLQDENLTSWTTRRRDHVLYRTTVSKNSTTVQVASERHRDLQRLAKALLE